MRLVLRGGRILDPSQKISRVGDLILDDDGRIAGLTEGPAPASDYAGDLVMELTETQLVVPGLIDVHSHLREPGQEHKETIATGSLSAAAGGFTTVLCMPNTAPPIDSAAVVALVLQRAAAAEGARVLPIAAACAGMGDERLSEMSDLRDAGAVAFTDDAFPIQRAETMRRVMEYSASMDLPFIAHCEDKTLTEGGAMNEGATATRLGLRGMPTVAEDVAVIRNILLAEYTGCHLHVAHVSTQAAAEMIREAKRRGVHVTGEACPHHFSLTDAAVHDYNTDAKMNPPLRTGRDVDAVIEALRDRTLECIATDHAPHAVEEKGAEFADAPFGIVGFETCVGVTWTDLVADGALTPAQAVARLSTYPARIFRLEGGTLHPGARADVTVLDPDREWTVQRANLLSKSKNTPYDGSRLVGKPVLTVVAGRIVYNALDRDLAPRAGRAADSRAEASA